VIQLSEIGRGREMRALVRLLAARSGQLVVPAALGNELGVSRQTVVRYLELLEEVFLITIGRSSKWYEGLAVGDLGK